MDFRSPQPIIDALLKRVDHGIFGYTRPLQGLSEAVIEHLKNEYDWSIEEDWLVWLPGLVTGLNLACRAVGDDGDEVLSAVPVYPPFLTAPRNSLRNLVTTHLVEDRDRWVFDFADMERESAPEPDYFSSAIPITRWDGHSTGKSSAVSLTCANVTGSSSAPTKSMPA